MKPGESTPCAGEGRSWFAGTGVAICPICHRGTIALTGKPVTGFIKGSRSKWADKHIGPIPAHTMR